ncbi:MAG: hypothetical protein RJA26_591 [Actinomycetota bacterium]|jgi:hypothetical protein
MAIGLLKFLGVLALFVVAGAYFNAPLIFSAGLGIVVGAAIAVAGWWQTKTRTHTRKQLGEKPFDGKLPTELGLATTTAVALEGNNEYRQTVVGSAAFAENFEDLRQYAGVADGSLLELQAALVVEPANRESAAAVAVTAGGVVLGYIPNFESESLYAFLMQHRGMARVNANIYIQVEAGTSKVELDLVRPFRVVPGV